YQARLRSRFGRAWRRKAPVESLMPLRLARYGVPLAETTPAGLVAAGIEEPPIALTVAQVPPASTRSRESRGQEQETTEQGAMEPDSVRTLDVVLAKRFAEAYKAFLVAFQVEPTAAQLTDWLRDPYGITTGAGLPLSENQLRLLLPALQARYSPELQKTEDSQTAEAADQSWYDFFHSAWRTYRQQHGTSPDAACLDIYMHERDSINGVGSRPINGVDVASFAAALQDREPRETERPADRARQDEGETVLAGEGPQDKVPGVPAPAAREHRGLTVNASAIDKAIHTRCGGGTLTAPDRYYLAWMEYQDHMGVEPSDEQLSAHCAEKGLLGRGKKPISPANLRRHFVRWRVYNVWAGRRSRTRIPEPSDVARQCAERGITAQYNRAITPAYVAGEAEDFERRWQMLVLQRANTSEVRVREGA
ncbi:hypothetical protein ACFVA2_45565, partial [Streptomyces chartreusis]